ncbi:TIGR02757 family protein [Vampirovibrio sp.]|uniref:TIGR02757 family protein n=1 Tax=Vampirovibrio sp. TaxID=2717857 RepID=UPI0035935FDA
MTTQAPPKPRKASPKKQSAGNTGLKKKGSGSKKAPAQPAIAVRTQADWLGLAPALDGLVHQYKVPAYIASDPIQIPYRFAENPQACELVAFITALFSYGRRDFIIETVNHLFQMTDQDPVGFMESFNPQRDGKRFKHFIYRFNKGADLTFLWERLQWAYREYGSLEALFEASVAQGDYSHPETTRLKAGIAGFTNQLLGNAPAPTYGLKFLLAHPDKGGACKRFNMFLRWMVREDADPGGRVDFGLWKRALRPAELLMPLDTHVMQMNRKLGLTSRKDGSWRTAEAITDVFRQLCPEDPVKYDYALFGFSLDKRLPEELLRAFPR